MVLSEGRLTAIYDAKEATQENIMAAATNRDRRAPPEAGL